MEHNIKFYKSLRLLLSSTHHTDIGILYLWLAFINFILAGISAFTMRLQLAQIPVVNEQVYYSLVTLHGLAMILFFIVPAFTGLANYILPKMIGAPDLYWPKINALAFWMNVPATAIFWLSILVGKPMVTWTLYAPFSVVYQDIGVDFVGLGVLLLGISTTISAINFIMTILRLRHPSIPFSHMPLFVWAFFSTAILIIVVTPPLAAGLIMLELDRHLGTHFFVRQGDPILWQHIFWFFGHPEVYILVLPAMGVVSEVLPRMARRPIYGFRAIALSSLLIAIISYIVWVHHMFTTPTDINVRILFMVTTVAVAIPTGIKVFNWIATLYGGRIRLCTPMAFTLAFIGAFIIGGITGVYNAYIPVNYAIQDTYWVLGHFHFVVLPIVFALIGGIYYYFPFITGKMFSEKLSKISFILIVAGTYITYTPWFKLGLEGMPRRYYSYPSQYYDLQLLSTIGTFVLALGLLIFFIDIIKSWLRGRPAPEDPWGAAKIGLPEFATVSRPIHLNGSSHDLHYPHPYAAIAGMSTVFAGLGAFFVLIGNIILGSILIAIFIAVMSYWFYKDYLSKATKLAHYLTEFSLEKLAGLKRGDVLIATLIFILSEATIFGTAFSSYVWLRASYPTWPPPVDGRIIELVDVTVPLINSIFLFTSGGTMHIAYEMLKRGFINRFKIFLALTFILGTIFIIGQIIEYSNSGLSIKDGVYGSTFYLITGLHGTHVIMGLAFMLVIMAMVLKRKLSKERYHPVLACTLYWHFVDIVWVFVLAIVYFNLIQPPVIIHHI